MDGYSEATLLKKNAKHKNHNLFYHSIEST